MSIVALYFKSFKSVCMEKINNNVLRIKRFKLKIIWYFRFLQQNLFKKKQHLTLPKGKTLAYYSRSKKSDPAERASTEAEIMTMKYHHKNQEQETLTEEEEEIPN
ncbi:hypothetical protein V2J09_003366 [Rumex salicifolius]